MVHSTFHKGYHKGYAEILIIYCPNEISLLNSLLHISSIAVGMGVITGATAPSQNLYMRSHKYTYRNHALPSFYEQVMCAHAHACGAEYTIGPPPT